MTKAGFAQAVPKKVRPSLPADVGDASLTLPSARSFSFLSFPQLHTAVLRGRPGLQCLTKISAGYRRDA
jgi:hypothetical protein